MSKKNCPKEDDLAWVFDSLVDFLRGPIWNIPIMNFIEQRSMIFEPDGVNHKSYKKAHDDYKDLVDFMLGTYMDEIGIAPELFENACRKSSTEMKTKFHKLQFEQLWAADDVDMFQRMMIRTNIELQLQALELLQHRHGVIPASFAAGDDHVNAEERRILEEVIKRSLNDQKRDEAHMDRETKELERALARAGQTKQHLESGRDREQELIRNTMKLAVSETSSSGAPRAAAAPAADKISPDEIKKRQEYLRQQRDKLLAMKRSEREKLLERSEKSESTKRPKTSRAARSALNGRVDPKTMEMRKHLAQALRREVVDKK